MQCTTILSEACDHLCISMLECCDHLCMSMLERFQQDKLYISIDGAVYYQQILCSTLMEVLQYVEVAYTTWCQLYLAPLFLTSALGDAQRLSCKLEVISPSTSSLIGQL